MPLAIPCSRKPRVARSGVINRLALQIREPCLDRPGWNKHGDALVGTPNIDAICPTCLVELGQPSVHAKAIAIDHDDERLPDVTGSVGPQFPRKQAPHKLLSGAAPARALLHTHRSRFPAHRHQEPAETHLMLRVLAHEHHLDTPTHSSQPLATISESLRPDALWEPTASRSARTEIAPVASRFSRTPASPPR